MDTSTLHTSRLDTSHHEEQRRRPTGHRRLTPFVKGLTIGTGAALGCLLAARIASSRRVTPREDSAAIPPFRRSVGHRALALGFRLLNDFIPWHRLPGYPGVLNLIAFQGELREKNLHDTSTGNARGPKAGPWNAHYLTVRSIDGSYNDLRRPEMGMAGTRFGRNVPRHDTYPDAAPELFQPSPREVSRRLLARTTFVPVQTLNLLAAAWIQFQTHDWFSHGGERPPRENDLQIPLAADDSWPEKPMRVPRSAADPTRGPGEANDPPTYINEVSHWWDGSAVYGSKEEVAKKIRTGEDGKMHLKAGRLPIDPETGLSITGFTNNWWLGLALMHTLFTLEHNAICERLKREYSAWSDEQLYQRARLINAALMAKIHVLDWTPAILLHPALQIGMAAAWWGLATERVARLFGRLSDSDLVSGIPGSTTEHHGVPFALTEEFTSVYRLHPLIPDEYTFSSIATGETLKRLQFSDIALHNANTVLGDAVTMGDAFYSFGISHPGAVTLHNFPQALRDFTTPDGFRIDLAAVDITRDRERGVPRYSRFRELVHRKPVRSFEEVTSNRVWAQELREVYDNQIDRIDLMVGLYAEDLPRGFLFSDTTFRIFILMAARRLKSDRFFTTDFTPRVYTSAGMNWINDNDMSTVLLRHYPELGPAFHGVKNAFAPWNSTAAR